MKTFSDMTVDERRKLIDVIESMIGDGKFDGNWRDPEYISKKKSYKKTFEKLVKIAEQYGTEKLKTTIVMKNGEATGKTTSGKKYEYIMNCYGVTERSRYCGTLYIDGKCKFTSGKIEKVIEYIINN